VSWGDVPAPEGASDDGSGWGQEPPRNQLRPLNLGDVLDGTFRLLRDHWRAFVLGVGIVVVPMALVSGLVSIVMFGVQPGLADMLQDDQALQEWAFGTGGVPADLGTAFAVSALAFLVSLLLTPLQYGAAVHIAATGYRNDAADAMASLRAAGRRYWGLLGATFLLWLVPFLIFLAPVVLILVGGVAGSNSLAIIGTLGLLVSAVIALIAAVRIMVAVPALMIEHLGPAQAVRRSNMLIQGKTGLALGTIIVVYLITFVIGWVLAWPFQAIGSAIGAGAGVALGIVGQMVSTVVTTTLLGAALVLIYFDRRVRKEGYDLTELANELGEPRDTSW
jgi:hypothetical protein